MSFVVNYGFILGIPLTAGVFLFNIITRGSPYSVSKSRTTCILYAISLALIAFATYGFFGVPSAWWHDAIVIGCSLMAFGALLEAKKKLPLAPRAVQKTVGDD